MGFSRLVLGIVKRDQRAMAARIKLDARGAEVEEKRRVEEDRQTNVQVNFEGKDMHYYTLALRAAHGNRDKALELFSVIKDAGERGILKVNDGVVGYDIPNSMLEWDNFR